MTRGERGFVFAAVVAVLVIAAALLSGAFFFALQEERLGRGTQAAYRALGAAEAGAAAVAAGWSAQREGALLPGESLPFTASLAPGAGAATGVVAAWGEHVMLVRSRGVDPTALAEREVALLVRLDIPPLAIPAAVTTARGLAGFDAYVSGTDSALPGQRCPPGAALAKTALLAQPWSDWDSLAARAAIGDVLPSSSNPIVLVPGDLDVIGGSGRGILMVAGNARIAGGAELTGVLLVRGRLDFIGTGGRVLGVVRADTITASSSVLSGSVVDWSSCAVRRALRAVARPAQLAGWYWSDLSGGW